MFFKIKVSKSSYESSIAFLNSSAKSFYKSKDKFIDNNYETFFKSSLLTALVDLDRVIRGTFNCDIYLKNANLETLKRMFPNAINNIFKIKSDDELNIIGHWLETLRNINAHALISKSDLDLFKYDFSSLAEQKKMNEDICYFNDGITIAGIIFVLLNFCREETIANLTKIDYIFSLVSCGKYEKDDGLKFVNDISNVNLEMPIRSQIYKDVFESIVGEINNVEKDENGIFSIQIGSPNKPTFSVFGSFKNNTLVINAQSLTKTYYEKDYTLKIVDKKGFIKLSNSLPPFVLVDYLKQINVNVFNKDVYEKTKKFDLLYKLNKPKFYIDKNLDIILLPNTISDFRIQSSVFSDSLMKIFLLLENYIFRTRKINKNKFSSISEAMKAIGVPENLITNTRYIRNFAAHGYILNEYNIYYSTKVQFSIDLIIKTLKELLDYFEKTENDIFEYLFYIINNYLIKKIISTKYKKILSTSADVFESFPNHDKHELSVKNAYVNNSFFNTEVLNTLAYSNSEFQPTSIICIKLSDYEDCLYLMENNGNLIKIDNFALCHLYQIKDIVDKGLIKYYFLGKIGD